MRRAFGTAVTLSLMTSACATIAPEPPARPLSITSEPPGATVFVEPVGLRVTTPASPNLSADRVYSLRYALAGFQPEVVVLTPRRVEGAGVELAPNPAHASLTNSTMFAIAKPVLAVTTPRDTRFEHTDEPIGGTSWLSGLNIPNFGRPHTELVRELAIDEAVRRGVFADVVAGTGAAPQPVLSIDVQTLCSWNADSMVGEVAGLAKLGLELEREGEKIVDMVVEQAVTDANDPNFSGRDVGSREERARVAIADAIRLALARFGERLDDPDVVARLAPPPPPVEEEPEVQEAPAPSRRRRR